MPYRVLGTGPGGELWTETAETAEVALEIARCMDCDGGHSLRIMTPEHDVFDRGLFERLVRHSQVGPDDHAVLASLAAH